MSQLRADETDLRLVSRNLKLASSSHKVEIIPRMRRGSVRGRRAPRNEREGQVAEDEWATERNDPKNRVSVLIEPVRIWMRLEGTLWCQESETEAPGVRCKYSM